MKIEKIIKNNTEIASIIARGIVIKDTETAIDLMMNVKYEMGIKNPTIKFKNNNRRLLSKVQDLK